MDYCRGWAWQQIILTQRLAARKNPQANIDNPDVDSIFLLEHAPVYTLGRGASEEHLLFWNDPDCQLQAARREKLSRKYRGHDAARLVLQDRNGLEAMLQQQPLSLQETVTQLAGVAQPVMAPNGVPIYRVDRGGEVTFHGPSQLVVYPLLDLKQSPFQADLHWFLRQLEEAILRTLMHYGIEGTRDDIHSGVWVGDNKIAAIGVSATHWVSSHGFSLNVSPNLDFFDTSVILPCGIAGRGITSMEREFHLAQSNQDCPSVASVAEVVLQKMAEVFQMKVDDPSKFTRIF